MTYWPTMRREHLTCLLWRFRNAVFPLEILRSPSLSPFQAKCPRPSQTPDHGPSYYTKQPSENDFLEDCLGPDGCGGSHFADPRDAHRSRIDLEQSKWSCSHPAEMVSVYAKLENWMEAHTSGFIAILYLSKNIWALAVRSIPFWMEFILWTPILSWSSVIRFAQRPDTHYKIVISIRIIISSVIGLYQVKVSHWEDMGRFKSGKIIIGNFDAGHDAFSISSPYSLREMTSLNLGC